MTAPTPTTEELSDLMRRADAIIKELAKLLPMQAALRQWRHDDLKNQQDCIEEGEGEGSRIYDTCLHESEMELRELVEGLLTK